MIIKKSQCTPDVRPNMKGGDGEAIVTEFVTSKELNEKGRLFGKIRLEPGSSIGYHVHEGESELFYVLEGVATYNDNGEVYEATAGDTLVVSSGNGHSIATRGTEPLEVIALIVYA